MEAKLSLNGENISFAESLWETLQRLPAYISTILFKVFSLVLTMAYLRLYSIVAIILLVLELVIVTWFRFKNLNSMNDFGLKDKVFDGFYLVIGNIGVVNAYSLYVDENEKEEDIQKFVRQSTITSFLHHASILIFIMVLGWNCPDAFEHWNSSTFLLPPGDERFYWVFSFVLLIGVYSMTTVLYRARHIITVKVKEIELAMHEDVEANNDEIEDSEFDEETRMTQNKDVEARNDEENYDEDEQKNELQIKEDEEAKTNGTNEGEHDMKVELTMSKDV